MTKPQRAGPFLLLRRLESQGGAELYRARRTLKPGQVSGPFLLRLFSGSDRDRALELVARAEWSARAAHPSIPRVLEVGVVEGRLYAVAELVEGRDLERVIRACLARDAPPSVPAAVAVGAQLAGIGRELHDARGGKVLLGAFGPRDVVLGWDGRVRLHASGARPNASEERDPFVAPEVAKGAAPSTRSDAWTVARVLRAALAADVAGKRTPKVSSLYQDALGPLLVESLAKSPKERLALVALEQRLLELLELTDDSPFRLVTELLADAFGKLGEGDDEGALSVEGLSFLTAAAAEPELIYPRAGGGSAWSADVGKTQAGAAPAELDDDDDDVVEPGSELFGRVLEDHARELDGPPSLDRGFHARPSTAELDLDAIARSSVEESDEEQGDVFQGPPAATRVGRPYRSASSSPWSKRVARSSASEEEQELEEALDNLRTSPTVPMKDFSAEDSDDDPEVLHGPLDGGDVFTRSGRLEDLVEAGRAAPAAPVKTRVLKRGSSSSGERPPAADDEKTAFLENPQAVAQAGRSAAISSRPGAAVPLSGTRADALRSLAPEVDDEDDRPTERLSADVVQDALRQIQAARQAKEERKGSSSPDGGDAWGTPLTSSAGAGGGESPMETQLLPVHDVRDILGKKARLDDELRSGEEPPTLDELLPDDPGLGVLVVDVPDGAIIFVNGEQRGAGHTVVDGLDRFRELVVRVHLKGHLPWTGNVSLQGMRAARIEPELVRR